MLRIIGGKCRGFKLERPPEDIARPTMDRVRQAVFNVLDSYFMTHDISWDSRKVLDAFAGSGAYGFESFSRGVPQVCFVEWHKSARQILTQNAAHMKMTPQAAQILCDDFLKIKSLPHTYNLVFLDPPFGKGMLGQALNHLRDHHFLDPHSIVVCESPSHEAFEMCEGYEILQHKDYGSIQINVLISSGESQNESPHS